MGNLRFVLPLSTVAALQTAWVRVLPDPPIQLLQIGGSAGDNFGTSVAISGDTLIVGSARDDAPAGDQGSAHVYRRNGGNWDFEATLVASNGTGSDGFGTAVRLSGDTAVIGASGDNSGRGSAYVFVRSGTLWTQQAQLTAPDGAGGNGFGTSVGVAGNTVMIGAPFHQVGANTQQGAVYVFTRSGTIWSFHSKLLAPDGAQGDVFGKSVAMEGDTVVVGADGDNVGATSDQGSAYVFTRSETAWDFQAQLNGSTGGPSEAFGNAVAVYGDTALVGCKSDKVDGKVNQGGAYVFVRSGSTWTEQARFVASDGLAGDRFGWSVAVSASTAVIGTLQAKIGANIDQGCAHIFTRSGTAWTHVAKLADPNGAAGDNFGNSAAIEGDTAVVGAWTYNVGQGVNQKLDQGTAWIIPLEIANSCPADLNHDAVVDDSDFTIFIFAYNILDCAEPSMPPGCPSDLNTDDIVEDTDFQVFVVAYNELVCP